MRLESTRLNGSDYSMVPEYPYGGDYHTHAASAVESLLLVLFNIYIGLCVFSLICSAIDYVL